MITGQKMFKKMIPLKCFRNDCQRGSNVLYIFASRKVFGKLLNISPKMLFFFKHLVQSILILKYGLRIKNSKPLEVEDKTYFSY